MIAGWIPVSKSLSSKMEVMTIAGRTGRNRHEVVGLLVDFWAWVDEESLDGRLPGLTIDALLGLFPATDLAFWDAVIKSGWLLCDDTGLTIPNHERWFGRSAKRRLQENERKKAERAASEHPQNDRKPSASDADKKRPREQKKKKTEEKTSSCFFPQDPKKTQTTEAAVGDGGEGEGPPEKRVNEMFEQFWAAYPHPKPKDKRFAWAEWLKLSPDESLFAQIMNAVEKQRRSEQWRRGVIPNAETWLKGHRWLDGT